MSTQIAEIIGRKETLVLSQNPTFHDNTPRISYIDSTLNIVRFWGGNEKGRMLQLTINNNEGHSYIQLTEEQAKDLSIVLDNAFDDKIYPSE